MYKSDGRDVTEIPATPFAFVWFSLKPYKKWLFWAIFLTFTRQLFSDLEAYALKGFIDAANNFTNNSGIPLFSVFLWVALIPILLLLTVVCIRGTEFMMHQWTARARTFAVKKLFEYLSLHSLSYFSDRFSGSLSTRVGTISSNVSRLAYQFTNQILSVLFSLIITFFLIKSASIALATVFIIGFIILIPINFFLTRKQIVLSEKMSETFAKLQGQVIDAITHISAIQHYVRRNYEIDHTFSLQ